jgi:lipoprotein LprG
VFRRLAFPVLAALVLLVPAACTARKHGSAANLPPADQLLKDAAARMREVTTARFTIDASGNLTLVPVRRADGRLTREGNAQGTVAVEQAGALSELQFVIVGQTAYIKGPTGGWQSIPLSLASTVYDPSALLKPERGVAKLIETASSARTEAREQVDGVDAYRIAASFDPQLVASLIPGAGDGVTGQLWIDANTRQLLRARFKLPDSNGGEPAIVTVRFSEFNQPVNVSAP